MGTTPSCQAAQIVNDMKKDIRDIATLKQHAAAITKNQSEIGRLTTEIANLEEELSSTGSSKTADDVQTELDALSNEM
jgi:DNA repair protein RAD50